MCTRLSLLGGGVWGSLITPLALSFGMLELSLACTLTGLPPWRVLVSVPQIQWGWSLRTGFLEATPGAYQEAQKKGVAAGKCSVPSGSLEEGDRLLLGQEGRSERVSPGCSGSPCQEAGSDEGEEVRRSVHPGLTGYSMQYVGITGTPLWQYSLQEARVRVKHCQPLWTSRGWA